MPKAICAYKTESQDLSVDQVDGLVVFTVLGEIAALPVEFAVQIAKNILAAYLPDPQPAEPSQREFVRGAQMCREMLARFVEQGGDRVTANSIRLNWNQFWGEDPGAPVPQKVVFE